MSYCFTKLFQNRVAIAVAVEALSQLGTDKVSNINQNLFQSFKNWLQYIVVNVIGWKKWLKINSTCSNFQSNNKNSQYTESFRKVVVNVTVNDLQLVISSSIDLCRYIKFLKFREIYSMSQTNSEVSCKQYWKLCLECN